MNQHKDSDIGRDLIHRTLVRIRIICKDNLHLINNTGRDGLCPNDILVLFSHLSLWVLLLPFPAGSYYIFPCLYYLD